MEVILVVVLTTLTIPAVIVSSGVLRVVLCIALVLFFPGYTLVAALFPKQDSLDPIERVALSFVLSVAVVPLICLILNYTSWGIRAYPIVGATSGFILICSLVALWRRRRLPTEEQYEPRIRFTLPRFGGGSGLDLVVSVVLCLAIVGAIGALAYVMAVPKHVEKFSEFYLLGVDGMIGDYPKEATIGQPVVVTLGVINREHDDATYSVEVTMDGETVDKMGPIQLSNDKKWETDVSVVPTRVGSGQEVDFLLYKNDGPDPYLTLHLMLNVMEEA